MFFFLIFFNYFWQLLCLAYTVVSYWQDDVQLSHHFLPHILSSCHSIVLSPRTAATAFTRPQHISCLSSFGCCFCWPKNKFCRFRTWLQNFFFVLLSLVSWKYSLSFGLVWSLSSSFQYDRATMCYTSSDSPTERRWISLGTCFQGLKCRWNFLHLTSSFCFQCHIFLSYSQPTQAVWLPVPGQFHLVAFCTCKVLDSVGEHFWKSDCSPFRSYV